MSSSSASSSLSLSVSVAAVAAASFDPSDTEEEEPVQELSQSLRGRLIVFPAGDQRCQASKCRLCQQPFNRPSCFSDGRSERRCKALWSTGSNDYSWFHEGCLLQHAGLKYLSELSWANILTIKKYCQTKKMRNNRSRQVEQPARLSAAALAAASSADSNELPSVPAPPMPESTRSQFNEEVTIKPEPIVQVNLSANGPSASPINNQAQPAASAVSADASAQVNFNQHQFGGGNESSAAAAVDDEEPLQALDRSALYQTTVKHLDALQEFVVSSELGLGGLEGRIHQDCSKLRSSNRSPACALVAINGMGKSFLGNTLLAVTSVSEEEYRTRNQHFTMDQLETFTDDRSELLNDSLEQSWTAGVNQPNQQRRRRNRSLSSPASQSDDLTAIACQSNQEELQLHADCRVLRPLKQYSDGLRRESRSRQAERMEAYIAYGDSGSMDKIQERSWLLSSQRGDAPVTAHFVRLTYGSVWHARIRYISAIGARELAFACILQMLLVVKKTFDESGQLISVQVSDEDDDPCRFNETKWSIARTRHDAFVQSNLAEYDWESVGITRRQLESKFKLHVDPKKPLIPLPRTAAQLDLKPELEHIWGTSLVLTGNGENLQADRIYLRKRIRKYLFEARSCHAVSFITIYAPCRAVENIELWDLPGLNDPDPWRTFLTTEALAQADSLLCLLDRSLSADSLAISSIRQSGFLNRNFISQRRDTFGKIFLLRYDEKTVRRSHAKFHETISAALQSLTGDQTDATKDEREWPSIPPKLEEIIRVSREVVWAQNREEMGEQMQNIVRRYESIIENRPMEDDFAARRSGRTEDTARLWIDAERGNYQGFKRLVEMLNHLMIAEAENHDDAAAELDEGLQLQNLRKLFRQSFCRAIYPVAFTAYQYRLAGQSQSQPRQSDGKAPDNAAPIPIEEEDVIATGMLQLLGELRDLSNYRAFLVLQQYVSAGSGADLCTDGLPSIFDDIYHLMRQELMRRQQLEREHINSEELAKIESMHREIRRVQTLGKNGIRRALAQLSIQDIVSQWNLQLQTVVDQVSNDLASSLEQQICTAEGRVGDSEFTQRYCLHPSHRGKNPRYYLFNYLFGDNYTYHHVFSSFKTSLRRVFHSLFDSFRPYLLRCAERLMPNLEWSSKGMTNLLDHTINQFIRSHYEQYLESTFFDNDSPSHGLHPTRIERWIRQTLTDRVTALLKQHYNTTWANMRGSTLKKALIDCIPQLFSMIRLQFVDQFDRIVKHIGKLLEKELTLKQNDTILWTMIQKLLQVAEEDATSRVRLQNHPAADFRAIFQRHEEFLNRWQQETVQIMHQFELAHTQSTMAAKELLHCFTLDELFLRYPQRIPRNLSDHWKAPVSSTASLLHNIPLNVERLHIVKRMEDIRQFRVEMENPINVQVRGDDFQSWKNHIPQLNYVLQQYKLKLFFPWLVERPSALTIPTSSHLCEALAVGLLTGGQPLYLEQLMHSGSLRANQFSATVAALQSLLTDVGPQSDLEALSHCASWLGLNIVVFTYSSARDHDSPIRVFTRAGQLARFFILLCAIQVRSCSSSDTEQVRTVFTCLVARSELVNAVLGLPNPARMSSKFLNVHSSIPICDSSHSSSSQSTSQIADQKPPKLRQRRTDPKFVVCPVVQSVLMPNGTRGRIYKTPAMGNCAFHAIIGDGQPRDPHEFRLEIVSLLVDSLNNEMIRTFLREELVIHFSNYVSDNLAPPEEQSIDREEIDQERMYRLLPSSILNGFKRIWESNTKADGSGDIEFEAAIGCVRQELGTQEYLKQYLQQFFIYPDRYPHLYGAVAAFAFIYRRQIRVFNPGMQWSQRPQLVEWKFAPLIPNQNEEVWLFQSNTSDMHYDFIRPEVLPSADSESRAAGTKLKSILKKSNANVAFPAREPAHQSCQPAQPPPRSANFASHSASTESRNKRKVDGDKPESTGNKKKRE